MKINKLPGSDPGWLRRVSEMVKYLSKNCHDHLFSLKDISFDGLETIRIAGEPHLLRPLAQQLIASRLRIPIHYLQKCTPEVQAFNMDHWIKKHINEQLLFRFDGDDVRAVFSPRYKPVDNFEILERLDAIGYCRDSEKQTDVGFPKSPRLGFFESLSRNRNYFT